MKSPDENQPGDESLAKTMARGGGVIGSGLLLSRFLQFVNTLIIVRIVSRADYGNISLSYAVISVAVTVCLLGIDTGISRYIAMNRAQDKDNHLGRILCTSMALVCVFSTLSAAALFFLASNIAAALNQESLQQVLRFFAAIVVPESIIMLLGAVFRGLGMSRQNILFQELTVSVTRLVFLGGCLAAGIHFWGIVAAYIVADWVGAIAFLAYCQRYFRYLRSEFVFDRALAKDLLSFSIPLLAFNILNISLNFIVILILARYHSAEQVGLFNATQRLTQFISLPLSALLFLYLPMTTGLNESGKTNEIRRMYISVAKWATLLTLPVVMMLALDGTYVATLLFGDKYHDAGTMLMLMTLGMFVQTFFGPNGMTLIAMGESRFLLLSNIIGVGSSVLSCLLLIPAHGAVGGAIAIAVGMIISNIFRTVFLVARRNIHPFCYEFIAPVVFVVCASVLATYLLRSTFGNGHLVHLAIFLLLGLLTLASLLVTRSVGAEDIEIIGSIERKLFSSTRLTSYLRTRLKS